MAVDRPSEDAEGDDATPDAAAEKHPQRRGSGADDAAGRARPAEMRTRAEYYEALRAADGRPDDGRPDETAGNHRQTAGGTDHRPGTEAGRSGWDTVDARERLPPDAICIPPERAAHILGGDSTGNGGGHRHGTGKPGKTEFPASWDDEKVIDIVLDVAHQPGQPPVRQDRNNRWLCTGTREAVEVSVIVLPSGEVWTAWPEEGSPGVVRNPRKGRS
jgi:hypothetical protein